MPAASPTYLTGLVSGHALELDPHSVAAAPIALLGSTDVSVGGVSG
jgi:hypothetical protein